jgi:hypothetical protein
MKMRGGIEVVINGAVKKAVQREKRHNYNTTAIKINGKIAISPMMKIAQKAL